MSDAADRVLGEVTPTTNTAKSTVDNVLGIPVNNLTNNKPFDLSKALGDKSLIKDYTSDIQSKLDNMSKLDTKKMQDMLPTLPSTARAAVIGMTSNGANVSKSGMTSLSNVVAQNTSSSIFSDIANVSTMVADSVISELVTNSKLPAGSMVKGAIDSFTKPGGNITNKLNSLKTMTQTLNPNLLANDIGKTISNITTGKGSSLPAVKNLADKLGGASNISSVVNTLGLGKGVTGTDTLGKLLSKVNNIGDSVKSATSMASSIAGSLAGGLAGGLGGLDKLGSFMGNNLFSKLPGLPSGLANSLAGGLSSLGNVSNVANSILGGAAGGLTSGLSSALGSVSSTASSLLNGNTGSMTNSLISTVSDKITNGSLSVGNTKSLTDSMYSSMLGDVSKIGNTVPNVDSLDSVRSIMASSLSEQINTATSGDNKVVTSMLFDQNQVAGSTTNYIKLNDNDVYVPVPTLTNSVSNLKDEILASTASKATPYEDCSEEYPIGKADPIKLNSIEYTLETQTGILPTNDQLAKKLADNSDSIYYIPQPMGLANPEINLAGKGSSSDILGSIRYDMNGPTNSAEIISNTKDIVNSLDYNWQNGTNGFNYSAASNNPDLGKIANEALLSNVSIPSTNDGVVNNPIPQEYFMSVANTPLETDTTSIPSGIGTPDIPVETNITNTINTPVEPNVINVSTGTDTTSVPTVNTDTNSNERTDAEIIADVKAARDARKEARRKQLEEERRNKLKEFMLSS
jgi:hypothetical protein